ncbi:MAG: cupin domain-containing protein [Mariprofundaceae bacterium]|nr:cupin domain-containing protein [Mariprofundaceae bacterium]
MPKIEIDAIKLRTGSSYPGDVAGPVESRQQKSLGDAAGLTQFGANLVILKPGALSSLRHWHEKQDEFMVVTAGTCTLIDDHGETILTQGDCAAFPAGDPNGHHIVNQTDSEARFVVVGTRTTTEVCRYSDFDMMVTDTNVGSTFTRKDGTPYEGEET